MAQVLLTLRDVDRGVAGEALSDVAGRFSFGLVEPGGYEIQAEALGFRPVVATGIYVTGGQATSVPITIEASAPPVSAVDTIAIMTAGPSALSARGMQVESRRISLLPDPLDRLSAVVALSSSSDTHLGSEGLPGNQSLVVVDGVPFYLATHPASRGEALPVAGLSRAAFSELTVFDNPPDVEWTGAAGSFLALTTRSSVGPAGTALGGGWSSDPLWSSSVLAYDAPALTSFWGSAAASLPLSPDTSRVFVAAEGLQVETPLGPRLTADAAGALSGLDPGAAAALAQPAVERTRRGSGLARLDWSLGSGRHLMMSANVGHFQREFEGFGPSGLVYGGAPPETATDFAITGGFVSTYAQGLALELRGGITGSSRTFDPVLADLPSTTLVQNGLSFGGPGTDAADVSRLDIHLSPVVHHPLGAGNIKGGASIHTTQHDISYAPWARGQYFFTDAAAAGAGSGALVRSTGVSKSSFSTTKVGLFVQYGWEAAPRLHVTLGGRFDYELLPKSQIRQNSSWVLASGVVNDLTATGLAQVSGVGALSWDMQGDGATVMTANISIIQGNLDPSLLHDAYSHARAEVSRYIGSSLSWPGATPSSATSAIPLTILGPDSHAPRSTHASVGLRQRVADGLDIFMGATARRTDFLPRRRDLNLAPFPLAVDPYGRDVSGDLRKVGSVVVADPQSNRRFSDFDAVWAIDTDGWSDYRGVTVGLQYRAEPIDFFASYTRSHTRDNWVGAAAGTPEAQLDPGLPDLAAWDEGTSDFDVPDRLVAGGTLTVGPDRMLSATGVVRYESGLPFTPGYRAGVDINGDGSAFNDVAWVPEGGSCPASFPHGPASSRRSGRSPSGTVAVDPLARAWTWRSGRAWRGSAGARWRRWWTSSI